MNFNKSDIAFGGNRIRRIWDKGEWFFSIIDIVGVLIDSKDIKQYIKKMRKRDSELNRNWGTICTPLKLIAKDGKKRLVNCADKRGIFRIIQSIPSKKAEPFKMWLAKVGSERIDEIIDPELSIERAMGNYVKKGYSEKWINQRLKTIEVRKDLTDEWKRVGLESSENYAILTNDITEAWSGKSIREYKEFKNLKNENLRDNMTNLELVLNMLAEATTTEFSKDESPETFEESREVATKGGTVAGNTRRDIEMKLGKKIISPKNSREIIDLNKEKGVINKILK